MTFNQAFVPSSDHDFIPIDSHVALLDRHYNILFNGNSSALFYKDASIQIISQDTLLYRISIPPENQCFTVSWTADSAITGVNDKNAEQLKTSELSVYPNPATTHLSIQSPEYLDNATVKIYNVYGIEVYEGKMNGDKTTIPTDGLPIGAYYGVLNGERFKFIKRP